MLIGKRLALRVEDSTMAVRPVDSSGKVIYDSVSVALSLSSIVERKRSFDYETGANTDCNFPMVVAPWVPGVDVNSTENPRSPIPFGDVVRYEDLHNFNCEADTDEFMHNGVNIKRVKMRYEKPTTDIYLEALFELPDGSTIKEVYDKTNFTLNGTRYTTYYKYGTRGGRK